jgi:hypothetical protein
MKPLITAICFAAATAGLAAQTTTPAAGSGSQSQPAQAAPTTQPQPPAQTQSIQTNPAAQQPATAQNGKPLTITGCLQPAQSGQNAFQLIVPEAKQSTTNAKGVTTSYALTPAGGVDLQAHVNEMVELTGAELATPAQTASVVDQTKSQSEPAAVGTSGRADAAPPGAKTTPTVETTAKAEIVAKAMSVSSLKTVATKCQ